MDACVALGLSLMVGQWAALRPGPTLFAAWVSLILLRRRLAAPWLALLVVAIAVGALRARAGMARFEAAREALRARVQGSSRCAAEGVVASSPTSLKARPALGTPSPEPASTMSFIGDFDRVVCDAGPLAGGVRARLYGGPADLARGDRVAVVADLAPVQLFLNDGLDDPRPRAARRGVVASGGAHDVTRLSLGRGVLALIDRMRARVRARIEATYEPGAIPMARALVLGESDLDEADDEAFRNSGLSHLLAVSGTHLVVAVASAVAALAAVLRRWPALSARMDPGRLAALAGVILAFSYADFAGGSGSAWRAAGMLSVALGARALGRRPNGARAFGLSLVGGAVIDPLVAFDLSFLLSVAATAGLMVLGRPLGAFIASGLVLDPGRREGFMRAGAGAVGTTLAATTACAPLIASISPALPLGGILANLLAVPVGEIVALPLCLLHTVVGFIPTVERGAAVVASGSLLVVRAIARVTASATWLSVAVPPPTPWQLAILAIAAVAYWAASVGGRRTAALCVGIGALLVSELAVVRAGAPHDKLRITVLDVAQGDAALIDFPDGRAMLVDGGGLVGSPVDPGRSVLLPLLRARRRSDLAAVVLSHPHPDHFGGLGAVAEALRVAEFWDTGQGEREGAGPTYAALLATFGAEHVPIRRPDSLCGHPRRFGRAEVEVLAPCPEPVPFGSANDNSFVLRITLGERAALLVGDAEHEEERALLQAHAGALRADFLKVGHHGSRTSSSPEFLEQVRPTVATISCGVRNRFGHPNPTTLRNLAVVEQVFRTDRNGSIRWETDGRSTWVAPLFRPPR